VRRTMSIRLFLLHSVRRKKAHRHCFLSNIGTITLRCCPSKIIGKITLRLCFFIVNILFDIYIILAFQFSNIFNCKDSK
jgi:hypothetical protein